MRTEDQSSRLLQNSPLSALQKRFHVHAEVADSDGAVFNVGLLLMVVAVKVTGVCHSGHQKQLAAKVAEGGGLLGELDGGGGINRKSWWRSWRKHEEVEADTANLSTNMLKKKHLQ